MDLNEVILRAYPWWEMHRVRELSLGAGAPVRRQSNEWRHAPGLVDHRHRGVTTPNCDTLYSVAWLDLADGPILIEVPQSDLPYWSIAVMDLNTDNIAILGNRYPDSRALLVCGPDDRSSAPEGMRQVRSASRVVWLLARYLTGTDELAAQADALRRGVRLGRLQGDGKISADAACPPRVPLVPAVRKDPANFWRIIRATLDDDSGLAGPADSPMGLAVANAWPPGAKDWGDLDADRQGRFADAFGEVLQRVTANNSGNMRTRHHWRYPGKDIGNFVDNALYRAEVSLWGLGALPTSEAIYVSAITDDQGAGLHGSSRYRFRIPPEGIPVDAFWSLTLYEVDPHGGMYFCANELKRYAVGDRTEGLHPNPDGSIDIWIAHEAPAEPDRQANWLPAPAGQFRLMIRAYAPSAGLQSGDVAPPAVEKWVG